MRSSTLLAFASSLSSALAVYQGFNYGATQTDGSIKTQDVFEEEFKTAAGLVGTDGAFTSARLYTMIQGGTTSDVISAIPAAISTKTSLLLTLWASGGDAAFQNELTALKAAISTYGSSLGDLVAGISVGSEDLYRETPTGIAADSGLGADPDTLVNYISLVREAIKGTSLSGAAVGHVDTWNAWTNSSVDAVISAVDWLGVDEYPYYQDTQANGIENAKTLFDNAYEAVSAISGGKPVWITEAGWPVSGMNYGAAESGLVNAKTFWDQVGCASFGKINTWWYTLQDAYPTTPNPSFGVVGSTLTTTPLYDLSCANVTSSSSSAASTSTNAAKASSVSASIVSSARSAASHLATSGGGLSPSQSNGNGIGGSSATSTAFSTAIASSVASGVAGVGAGTGAASATGAASTGSVVSGNTTLPGSPTTSSGLALSTGGASSVSGGSMVGAIGAIVALMAAL